MKSDLIIRILISLLVLSSLLAACQPASPEPEPTNPPPSSTPAATATPAPPTTAPTSIPPTKPPTSTIEPLPGLIPDGILVNFEKSGKCSISGPTELSPGEYAFILRQPPPKINELGIPVGGHLDIRYLIEGKTTQDLLDHANYKDGTWWSAALDLIPKAHVDDGWANESRNEKYYIYTLEAGEYVVDRWTQNPHFYWYCGTLWVE